MSIKKELFTRKELMPVYTKLKSLLTLTAVGSWRRNKPFMRDLDFITYISLDKVSTVLINAKIINSIKVLPSRRKLSFTYKGIHIDIFYVKKEEHPYAMLHFTGDKTFNIAMRHHAKNKGYKLNQYGLYKGDKLIKVKTERDIFDIIGFPYRSPKDRSKE